MGQSGSFDVPPGLRRSPTNALHPGEVVASTYAIRDEIGRTDSGVVFEARDMLLDRLVALKLGWRDASAPLLLPEARRCAAVRDPCSIAIYGMGAHQGVEYVVGERVIGRLLGTVVAQPLLPSDYLAKLRTLVAAVVRVHASGIAIGDISGSTVLLDATGRMVLGRLSLSQIPALGPVGRVVAPEVVRGEVEASDPVAAEAIDLYNLGCIAVELANGERPFFHPEPETELTRHALEPPPRIIDLRADLPDELSDLVEWLLAKRPTGRPRTASDVLAQLDAIIDRLGSGTRAVRVLVVDDDASRARWLWSLVRRAHPAALVEIASEGTDAAHKLHRDLPDLVLIDAALRGVMNAYELCMYARGVESEHRVQLFLIGELSQRDRPLFADAAVPDLAEDHQLASAVLDLVRHTARQPPARRRRRTTISG